MQRQGGAARRPRAESVAATRPSLLSSFFSYMLARGVGLLLSAIHRARTSILHSRQGQRAGSPVSPSLCHLRRLPFPVEPPVSCCMSDMCVFPCCLPLSTTSFCRRAFVGMLCTSATNAGLQKGVALLRILLDCRSPAARCLSLPLHASSYYHLPVILDTRLVRKIQEQRLACERAHLTQWHPSTTRPYHKTALQVDLLLLTPPSKSPGLLSPLLYKTTRHTPHAPLSIGFHLLAAHWMLSPALTRTRGV